MLFEWCFTFLDMLSIAFLSLVVHLVHNELLFCLVMVDGCCLQLSNHIF